MKFIIFIATISTFFWYTKSIKNNACHKFGAYRTASINHNCFFSEDMILKTPEIIKKYTGEFQSHPVITKDGYILQLFRIPRKNPKGVVFFHHPFTVDSRSWVGYGSNNSLAFALWHAGYDIWLNNNRGTEYSQRHVNLTTYEAKYWEFSFHEIGIYDTPAEIAVIRKHTNDSQIIYIGQSMGTTSALIYGSMLPKEAKESIKVLILLGTAAYFKNAKTILKNITFVRSLLGFILRIILPLNGIFFKILVPVSQHLTRMVPEILWLANFVFALCCGWTSSETDPALMNFDAGVNINYPAFQTAMHYLQLIDEQTKFAMYDYGKWENRKRYGSDEPPLYPIGALSVPMFFVSSVDDILSSFKDTNLLIDELSNEVKIYGHLIIKGINHVQYFLGKNLKEIYFEKLIDFINSL